MSPFLKELRQELINTQQATPMLLDYLDDLIKEAVADFMVNHLEDVEKVQRQMEK